MAIPTDPHQIPGDRGWVVRGVFEPLEFSDAYTATLKAIAEDEISPGHSDVGIRNLLFTMVLSNRPQQVLEVGGHIGTASVVLAEALRLNGFGHLSIIEPQETYVERLNHYLGMADLTDHATILQGFSHEPRVLEQLKAVGGFDLIFVDACHDYEAVKTELVALRPMLSENGFFVLHDTSEHAMTFDNEGNGGVRRAACEFCAEHDDLAPLFFEYPMWLNPCGAAIIGKQSVMTPSPA
jgi:predicted O-methyltransferase YrrM